MKKLFVVVLSLLMWGSNAFAAANCTASITASTPTSDFVDHGDGTVTHTKTSLMWKQCSEGLTSGAAACTGGATTHAWPAALQLAETLNSGVGFAGYTDWRLPNIKELASIVEEQCNNPSINATIFPAPANNWYWSSSPVVSNPSAAWSVSFRSAYGSEFTKGNNFRVRLVRAGL